METLNTDELLSLLQHCANKLLLAYDKTMRSVYWEAYEKTAEACETLYYQHNSTAAITIH